MRLYPPLVESFQNAFVKNENSSNEKVRVYFSFSPYEQKINLQGNIGITLSIIDYKKNNSIIIVPTKDETILCSSKEMIFFGNLASFYDEEAQQYYVEFPQSSCNFNTGTTYKIQLRLFKDNANILYNTIQSIKNDHTQIGWEISRFARENINNFSEWSKASLIKCLSEPIFVSSLSSRDETNYRYFQYGLVPIYASLSWKDEREKEKITSYYLKVEINQNEKRKIIFEKRSDIVQSINGYNGTQIEEYIDIPHPEEIKNDEISTIPLLEGKDYGIGYLSLYYKTSNNYNGKLENEVIYMLEDKESKAWDNTQLEITQNHISGTNILKISNDNFGYIGDINFNDPNLGEGIHQSNLDILVGNLYIYRKSSKDNFKKSELMGIYKIDAGSDTKEIVINDNTVKSIEVYRYYAQFRRFDGRTLKRKNFELNGDINIYEDFYGNFLYRNDKQINLEFNFIISSLTPVVDRAKFDTLGGRYPKFTQNAMLKYKQFSFEGLISSEVELSKTFLNIDKFFTYYNDKNKVEENELYKKYYLPNCSATANIFKNNENDQTEWELGKIDYDNVPNNGSDGWFKNRVNAQNNSIDNSEIVENKEVKNTINYIKEHWYDNSSNDLDWHDKYSKRSSYDWLWEREFREELTDWLNDGKPKLFRTMTEGNISVILTDISLTPNATLGRRLYNISGTAYEVGDGENIEDLTQLGIYPRVEEADVPLIKDFSKNEYRLCQCINIPEKWAWINDSELSSNNTERYSYYFSAEDIAAKQNDWIDISKMEYNKSRNKIEFENIYNLDGTSIYNIQLKYYNPPWQNSKNYYNFNNDDGLNQNILEIGDNGYNFKVNDKTVFVGPQAYYQVPEDVNVESFRLNRADSFFTEYIVKEKKTLKEEIIENLDQTVDSYSIGQIESTLYPDEDILLKIQEDNFSLDSNKNLYKCIDKINKLRFEFEPYSLFEVKYEHDTESSFIIINESGYLNLMDKPIDNIVSIKYLGRRMNLVNKKRNLRQFEYYNNDFSEEKQGCIYDGKIYFNHNWHETAEINGMLIAKIPTDGILSYSGLIMANEFDSVERAIFHF